MSSTPSWGLRPGLRPNALEKRPLDTKNVGYNPVTILRAPVRCERCAGYSLATKTSPPHVVTFVEQGVEPFQDKPFVFLARIAHCIPHPEVISR